MKRIALLLILLLALAVGTACADTLVLPADTTTIGAEAFHSVNAETIVLPEGVISIADNAFSGNSGVLETVYVPDALMDREQAALGDSYPAARFVSLNDFWSFSEKSDHIEITGYNGPLTEVTVPSALKGKPVTHLIGAFDGNEEIRKVTIPDGVTYIGDYTFRDCASLTDITFPSTLNDYKAGNAFTGCGSNAEGPFYFVLPDNIDRYVGNDSETHGFPGCNAILVCNPKTRTAYNIGGYITFPDCYDYRFRYVGNANELYLMQYVGTGAQARIPDNVDLLIINESAFADCAQLTKVVIPEGVDRIGRYAFRDCANLTDITFPQSLTSIDFEAFMGCGSNETEPFYFRLPDKLTSTRYGDGTTHGYKDCSAVIVVTPKSQTAYQFSANAWITFENQYDYRYQYVGNTNELHLIRYVGTGAQALIPDDVELQVINESAFADCEQLTKVVIPDGVTRISRYTFKDCGNLTDITFPQSLTDIDYQAFTGCGANSETRFYFRLPDYVESTNYGNEITHGYEGCNAVLVVTPKSATAYSLSSNAWCTFEDQYDYRYQYVGNDNILHLVQYYGSAAEVSIPDDVELRVINSEVFKNHTEMVSVIIPPGVTTIETGAFENCRNLAEVSFPSSLERIGKRAFRSCGANNEDVSIYVLPGNVSSITGYGDDTSDSSDASFKNCRAVLVTAGEVTGSSLRAAHYNYYRSAGDAEYGRNLVRWNE